MGKPLASGLPAAAYGFSREVSERFLAGWDPEVSVTGGLGGTLAGNALSARLMRVTMESVLTQEAYRGMIALADRYTRGIRRAIDDAGLAWHITQLGCRAEYRFRADPPRNGTESVQAEERPLMRFMHLYALNRGVLLTPFHNMALMSPATSESQVDLAVQVFDSALEELMSEA